MQNLYKCHNISGQFCVDGIIKKIDVGLESKTKDFNLEKYKLSNLNNFVYNFYNISTLEFLKK